MGAWGLHPAARANSQPGGPSTMYPSVHVSLSWQPGQAFACSSKRHVNTWDYPFGPGRKLSLLNVRSQNFHPEDSCCLKLAAGPGGGARWGAWPSWAALHDGLTSASTSAQVRVDICARGSEECGREAVGPGQAKPEALLSSWASHIC